MVESVRDYAIFMLDEQGHVVTWNTGAERLKGYKATEIIGQHFSRFYPQEAIDRGWPEEELRRATADGRIEDEGWRLRKDGTRFWASVVITALRDESGTLRGFGKVTRDLTERRQAEENARRLLQEEAARKAAEESRQKIEQQRQQLHVTLSSIGDGVVVTDAEGRINFLNPVAAAMTGWKAEEAAGKLLDDVFRIVNEDTRQPVENPIHGVFRDNRVVELANHTSLLSRDGQEIPIEDSAAPIRDSAGKVVGAVLVFRDVTEKRRANEARVYLAAIVESSDDAIIGQTLDGRIASWNRGAERLYGYSAAEILGKPLALLVPQDHANELPQMLDQLQRGEFIEHFETQRRRKDGSRVDVSLTISPVFNAEGKIIGASKIARDITARKAEQRRLNEFLALLAHELRNPLAPLRSGLQVVQLAQNGNGPADQALLMMERQLHHLVRLIDDLLDISRISQGKLQLRKERISVAAVVEHALEVCGPLLNENDHALTVEVEHGPVYVEADRTRLAQTLCNLLNNAAKYSESGTPIWLRAGREGQQAVFRVRDAGMGISPELLPQVFEMFVQGDRSLEKSQGGLGIGLSIVKRLVEMHGGTVEAHSAGLGKGSEFIVRLPLVEAGDIAVAPRSTPAANAAGHRILVADDNQDGAKSMAMLLQLMKNEVRTAFDGEMAVAVAEEFRPDVILLDIGMPKLNGYEAARQIRGLPWGRDVTLVALTGWGQDEDRLKSEAAGFDFHLVKPVEPAELVALLKNKKASGGA